MIEQTKLILSASRALLFNIITPVRFIFVNVAGKALRIDVYSDRELTDKEKEIYFAVCGEITGDFYELDDSLSKVEFRVTNDKFGTLKVAGLLIYARHEDAN